MPRIETANLPPPVKPSGGLSSATEVMEAHAPGDAKQVAPKESAAVFMSALKTAQRQQGAAAQQGTVARQGTTMRQEAVVTASASKPVQVKTAKAPVKADKNADSVDEENVAEESDESTESTGAKSATKTAKTASIQTTTPQQAPTAQAAIEVQQVILPQPQPAVRSARRLPDAVKTKSHQSAPEKKTEISVQPTDPKINQTAQSIVVALARTATPSQPSTPVQGDEPAQASSQPPRRSINANASAGQAQTQAPAANTKASAEKENQSADVSVPASDVGKEKVNTVNPAAPAIPIAQTSIAASVPAVSAVEGIAATSPTAAAPALVQPAAAVPVPVTPQAAFVAANHPPIVMGMSGKLLPDGGTMHIRLAPPELGDLQISVHVSEGTVAASFETSNEQATRLLSHSLGELKISLESAGITVEKLQVSQMPSGTQGQGADGQSGRQKSDDQAQPDGQAPARDQQRREMLRRMWRRLAGDPLDLVA